MTSPDDGVPPAPSLEGAGSADGLLVVAFGAATDLRAPLEGARRRLAALLHLTGRTLPEGDAPGPRMAALRRPDPAAASGEPGGWVASLPDDPGVVLPGGGCWAEVLGAWRQPTVALLTGPQLRTGLPAAGTALLRQWRVPLVGLIQWGGSWDEAARRREGLPWLGTLRTDGGDPERVEQEVRLRSALRLRWGGLMTALVGTDGTA